MTLLIASISQFISMFISLFVIIDPFAVVPVYLSITEKLTREEQNHVCRKAGIVSSAVLLVFVFSGITLFNIFGISLPAFQIAGGLLLLILGISQLNSTRSRVQPDEKTESLEKDDISIFPLATPLIAGPGAISTVVLQSSQLTRTYQLFTLGFAVLAAVFCTYLTLRFATRLFHFLGKTGLNLLTRIMGILLTAIAVQFIINGLTEVARNFLHASP